MFAFTTTAPNLKYASNKIECPTNRLKICNQYLMLTHQAVNHLGKMSICEATASQVSSTNPKITSTKTRKDSVREQANV